RFVLSETVLYQVCALRDCAVPGLCSQRLCCTRFVLSETVLYQLWKVRGEEYRALVGDGWRWCARHRRVRHQDCRTRGLRAGPDKVVVGVTTESGLRGLPVTPQVFDTLAVKSPELKPCLLSPAQLSALRQQEDQPQQREKNEIIISNSGGGPCKQKVEVIETRLENYFEDGLVNVSRALVARMRLVYPKMPSPCSVLDSLLSRRLSMPSTPASAKGTGEEGSCIEGDGGDSTVSSAGVTDGEAVTESAAAGATIQEIPDSQRSATHRLRPAGHLLKEIRQHKLRYEALDESMGHYRCYYSECITAPSTCYSPVCRSKAKYRDKLINSVKNYTIVTSKPSPFTQVCVSFTQVGVYDVIKLCEMDFSEAAAAVEAKKKINNNNNNNSSLSSFFASASNCKAADGDVAGSKAAATGDVTSKGEISLRLEADLDESSQESDSLEQKFGLNGSKEGDVSNTPTCSGKVYLRKSTSSTNAKTKSLPKLPPLSNCGVGKDRYSVLVLPAWELKVLCRRWWRHNVSGFGHQAKSNPSVWPYQCPRPLFKQTWLYHTATLSTLSAVALQLRILWCCLRWDDMQEKGPSDGKRHITTDTEIVQTEVLKRKYSGRFSEKTEYLRRKVTIPLDVPKPVREFTPSQRSGLRKRRRAQSPEDKRPESLEEWIPEEQLLLWEIRLFGERLERAANLPKKSDSSTSISSKITLSASAGSSFELKQRMEEQLKQQRSVFQQQQRDAVGGTARTMLKISSITSSADASKPSLLTPIKAAPTGNTAVSSITPARKLVRTKDGRIISVQTLGSIQSGMASSNFTPVSTVLPKVHIASTQQQQQPGNKVIRLQTVAANPRMILPRAPRPPTVVQTTTPAPSPATVKLPNQNIQIIRLPDGQIQVKGLLDGQQMIQRADGKFQLINNKTTLATTSVAPTPVVQVTQQPKPTVVLSNSHQLVKLNGQQVLLRKEGAQVVSVGAGEALKTAAGGIFVNQQKPTIINSSIGQLKVTPDGSFVSTAPVSTVTAPVSTTNTVPKTDSSSLTLKVQVRMTHQGPKTIIQGLLPTVGLTKDHIRAIQQQVRTMLAQYNLKVDQLSPIMTLTLQMNNSSTTTTQATVAQPVTVPNVVPQQPAVVKQVTSPTVRVSGPSPVKVPAVIALKNNTSTFIRTASGSIIPAAAVSSASLDSKQSPSGAGAGMVGTTTSSNGGSQFVLTSDYIQETIQSALSRNDLSPDVEEKLMQLKKYNSEQTPDDQQQQPPIVSSTPLTSSTPVSGKRARDTSETGGTEGGKRSRGSKRARAGDTSRSPSAPHPARRTTDTTSSAGEDGTSPSSKKRRSGGSAATSPADDAKRKLSVTAKLESQLSRHKDLLKKDILKKRAFLEKDLQLQIHRELNVAKQQLEVVEKKGAVSSSRGGDSSAKKKRKLSSNTDVSWPAASASNAETVSSSTTTTTASSPPCQNMKKHKTSNNKKIKNKNKKIVCICRTPFDDTKFYVGCDLCANWYHGDCVGITEALSRTMNEYVCDDCANAKMNKELYCFCRQPYDETQFYICCEQCEDWYHGRCIGIMQGEADDIDDYICPKCQPNNVWNLPCQKKLTNKDYTELKKFAKTLVSHKNAWPFLDAVDPSQVPDYYKVVRQPMDLRTVERRVKDHHYNRLADFVGDIMLVLDNCRLYNPPNSSFVSCAATLESFCCSKLKLFKQKMTTHAPSHPQ
ncbi:Zinc finger PHD-finger, partial [Trinorchestia longiramus]